MPKPPKTSDRILDASLALFNEHGFAGTSNARIAEAAGIAVGNLWYHFRTKEELLRELIERARACLQARLEGARAAGAVLDAYVLFLRGSMEDMFSFRFLVRDRLQFGALDPMRELDALLHAHYVQVRDLLARMQADGLFRKAAVDLDVLVANLWMVARHWWDYLAEREGIERPTWDDQERGLQHVLALLTPHLTAAARRDLDEVARRHRVQAPEPMVG